MAMSNQEITLCASNAYTKKFYLNEHFKGLPEAIKEELQIMCVLYTEDIGGVLELVFDEDGNPSVRDMMSIGVTLDERIADGFYFARSLKLIKHLFKNPELLDKTLGEEIDFEF